MDNGTAVGGLGSITGTFTIGVITNPFGNLFTAPVTGMGTYVIHDGMGFDLTATLTWVNISQIGPFGFLNLTGEANLTSITYAGTNADLVALRNSGNAANVLDFTFIPPVTYTCCEMAPANTAPVSLARSQPFPMAVRPLLCSGSRS